MSVGKPASGQALGYIYQFERALFWLSRPEINYVSIETDDDVVAQLRNGEDIHTIYEQDKNSIRANNPFSNSNVNLWKTLAIWLNIQKENIGLKSRFILATNRRVNTTCIMYKLHILNLTSNYNVQPEKLADIYNDLIDVGSKLKGKAKEFYDICRNYTEDEFIHLLSKIAISSQEYQNNNDQFKTDIRQNLRIGDQVPFNSIYTKILGWVVSTVTDLWKQKKEGWVKSSELVNIKDTYIKELLDKPFLEQAVSAIPVLDYEREQHKKHTFIKQLNLIEVAEDEKIEAIDDFLRAVKERERWAENGSIPGQNDIQDMEGDIQRFCNQTLKKHIIQAKSNSSINEVDIGNLTYIDCSSKTNYTLAGYPVMQRYTIAGSLHILSDKLTIGWHPNWKAHLNPNNNQDESK